MASRCRPLTATQRASRTERETLQAGQAHRYTDCSGGSPTTNWLRATGGIAGEPYGLEADAFTAEALWAAFIEEATPYLGSPGPRLVPGAEPPAAAVAERLVAMSAAELRERGRRWRERLAAEA